MGDWGRSRTRLPNLLREGKKKEKKKTGNLVSGDLEPVLPGLLMMAPALGSRCLKLGLRPRLDGCAFLVQVGTYSTYYTLHCSAPRAVPGGSCLVPLCPSLCGHAGGRCHTLEHRTKCRAVTCMNGSQKSTTDQPQDRARAVEVQHNKREPASRSRGSLGTRGFSLLHSTTGTGTYARETNVPHDGTTYLFNCIPPPPSLLCHADRTRELSPERL